jgi:hypothetical protein
MRNPNNKYDYVGETHNRIAIDYLTLKGIYTKADFTNFLVQNKAKYNINQYFNTDILNTEISKAEQINLETITAESAVDYLTKYLPATINKIMFKESMTKLLSTGSLTEFNAIVIAEENKLLSMKGVSEQDLVALSAMLSTMRYSANLWN